MITGEGSVEVAVQAMKCGADDYLTKPLALKGLLLLLQKLKKQKRLQSYLQYHHRKAGEESRITTIVGESEAIKKLRKQIEQIVDADRHLNNSDSPTVLIQGETGSGKELVAKAIHFNGIRADAPFVEINCSAIPAELLEAELFGAEKGAYTGASERRVGLIESAEGGTLFIDEIGDMEPKLQAKLLKVIEEKKYRRLGDNRERIADVRFISATHRDLRQLIKEGRFREDLYYRLRVLSIKVPPLRERGNDIRILAHYFLRQFAQKYQKPDIQLTEQAEIALLSYHWPGNVRELRGCIEQAVLMNVTGQIEVQELAFSRTEAGSLSAMQGVADLRLEDVEKELIKQALRRHDGNITQAAKALGISRDTLRYRLDKYNLS